MANSRLLKLNEDGPSVKTCAICGRRIPISSPYVKCKECVKRDLFPKVKQYILDNENVNELVLADAFGIDKALIHEWVEDGYLEYRNGSLI